MPDASALIIDGYLGNPFAISEEARLAADATLNRFSVDELLRELLSKTQTERAEKLVLAVGHRQVRQKEKLTGVLDGSILPPDILTGLTRSRGQYLRVVAAAGRAHRALKEAFGSSDQMNDVRRKTWAACFGDSLSHMLKLERLIRDHDILVFGETGTGKELIARAIQQAMPGSEKGEAAPGSSINVAAVPDTLVESELFGHVKGAFTGATGSRRGRIRTANGGCLFLDEVGDLPLTTQVKLLRVIESNDVFPLGADRTYRVEVRYVAATHKRLGKMVKDKLFRQDLYERLAGNVIHIPPLRERPEDIVEIGQAFVKKTLGDLSFPKQLARIEKWLRSPVAMSHTWPGNVRELQNTLRNLLLGLEPGCRGLSNESAVETFEQLPSSIARGAATMQEVQTWYLLQVLERCDGNFAQAAKILDIDRSTVRRRARQITGK